jgi:hypothetical protein
MSVENQRVLDALERLAATLKELPDSRSPDPYLIGDPTAPRESKLHLP